VCTVEICGKEGCSNEGISLKTRSAPCSILSGDGQEFAIYRETKLGIQIFVTTQRLTFNIENTHKA